MKLETGPRFPRELDLPVRLVEGPSGGPVLSVDGAWDAPGLNLSHWPGHRTPAHLRHALSTGSAIRFARLDPAERARLTAGLEAVENNHFDTDGLCSMWAVLHPNGALALEERLLATAAAGDFFAYPDDHALALDALIGALPDPERSPLAAEFAGLSDRARRQRALEYGLEHLGAWLAGGLDGPLAEHRAVWWPQLERTRLDREDLARCARTDFAGLDLAFLIAPLGLASRGPGRSGTSFTPGRHALFCAAGRDRVLVSAPGTSGSTHRLVVGTRSWFDLPDGAPPPRFDLGALARALAAAEGADPEGPLRWRYQPTASASPELWFGGPDVEHFAEENAALAPSRLSAEVLAEHLVRLAPATALD